MTAKGLLLIPVVVLAMLGAAAPAEAGTTTVTFRHGLLSVGGYEVVTKTDPVRAPQLKGFITDMHARLVDRAGNPLPVQRLMLHHVVFLNLGATLGEKQDLTYCKGGRAERFYGTGEEDQALDLPPGYGYPIKPGDRWRASWMLMNHRGQLDEAYIEYTMTITDDPATVPVTPFWIGVVGCKTDPIFNVPGGQPPGSLFRKKQVWTSPIDGRIVAGGAHLHGGAKHMDLIQRNCQFRTVVRSRPLFGLPSHPYYNVLPKLHEPGPIGSSWWTSAVGIPIAAGERMTAEALYDASNIHTRAMGILHIYVAPPGTDQQPGVMRCRPLPPDAGDAMPARLGVLDSPRWRVPLTGLDAKGRATAIDRPPGRAQVAEGPRVQVTAEGTSFDTRNLVVKRGTRVTWKFRDPIRHDVTVVDGPEGFASLPKKNRQTFTKRLTRSGVYKLLCSLHPVAMSQRIVVR